MTGEKVEGTDVVDVIEPSADGKHPDSVPWEKYVGVKEAWGKSKTKVSGLEEQLKTAVKPDEHARLVTELTQTKEAKVALETQIKTIQEASAKDLRTSLISKGVPEVEVNAMSKDALEAASKVIGYMKPRPDLGGGGGSGGLKGSPQELARQAYSNPPVKK
jgi:hypothetical protein